MTITDTRLLSVFDEIHKTRSVSRAAEALGLGQPAVSVALAKLRRHFGDPLFVRTSAGMEPTPLGEELLGPIRTALDAVGEALGRRSLFEPTLSERRFRICMTDISQLVILPKLWSQLRATAPGVRIEVLPLASAGNTAQLLETGAADLAIGFMPQLDAGFYQQVLFRQHYVVLASADHSRIRAGLDLEQFQTEDHVVFTTAGTGHQIIDQELARQGIRRRIALTIPNFLGAAFAIERTNLLMIIPRRLGELLRGRGEFSIFPLPFPMPDYAVKQHWHERYHHDHGNRWLRIMISELVSEDMGTLPNI